VANETYSFEIAAEVTKARKAVESFAKDTQKQLNGISSASSTTALATGFLAVKDIAIGAFRAISDVVGKAIDESIEAEKANIQLANSMKLVGDFTQVALDEFNQYADALSKTSEASDDQIKSSLALAKSFSLTNDEAKRVVTAATELSAVTGDSLNSSVEKLAKTFNGTISKELKQIIPELRTLTEEQLRSGEAVDIVAGRFKGSAAVINDSFGGSINQVKKSLSNLLEEIGNVITRTQAFKAAIQGTTGEIDSIAKAISEGNFAELFFNVEVGEGFSDAAKRLEKIRIEAAGGEQAVKELSEEFARLKEKGKLGEIQIQNTRKLNSAREKALEEFNAIRKQLELAGLTEVERINKDAADKIKVIRNAINTGAVQNSKEIQDQIAGVEADRINKTFELEKQTAEKLKADLAKIRAENDRFGTNAAGSVTEALISGQQLNKQQSINAAAGFTKTILEGAEGARKLVVEAGSTAVMALTGIPKEVSGPIIDALSQGPDKIKELVRAFASQIPEIVKNIALAIPVLIEEISKAIPKIVEGLVAAIPEIIQGLVRSLPTVAAALAAQMPLVAIELVTGIVKNIPEIVKGFAEEFLKIPQKFVEALLDALPGGNLLGGGGGGGGGGPLSGIPIVGDLVGGISDIASSLNPFDLINQNRGAERFVPGGETHPLTVNLTIGQQQLSRVLLDLDRGGFRTAAQ
jgi:predicted Zn-dependent protease with MMP-like domain